MRRIMNWVFSFTLVCSNMVLTSCSNKDETVEPDKTYTGIPLVILDADIGSSTDDLFALEMLYRYDEQRLCRLLGVVVDREGEANADLFALHPQRTLHHQHYTGGLHRLYAHSRRKRALPEARRCPVGRHDAGENQNDEQNEIEGVP